MSPAANRPRRGSLPTGMRVLLGVGFLLAIGATVLVVFTEQAQWLRFAVLLALWAALIAAFAVARSRRDARNAEMRAEESKRTYELELHREISARREYEIGVAEAAREDAELRHREELAGLREQLDRLNTTLSGLLEGDLLFERLTLSAESTRVRQVGDGGRGRLTAMTRAGQIEGGVDAAGPFVGRAGGAPAVAGPGYPPPGFAAARPPREDDTVQFPRAMFGPGAQPPAGGPVGPAVVDSAPVAAPVDAPREAPVATEQVVAEPVAAVEPEVVAEREEMAEPEVTAEPEGMVEPEATAEPEVTAEPAAVDEPAGEAEPDAVNEPVIEAEPADQLEPERGTAIDDRPEPAGATEPESAPEPEPIQPEPASAASEPTWQLEPTEPETPSDEPETHHSAGISVADLLAAYGANDGAPRRRRRAQD